MAIFAQIAIFAKIASLQGATFGIQFKLPAAGDFSPVSPLHAFLDISDVNSRIDGVIKDLAELKSSLQFTQKDVEDLKPVTKQMTKIGKELKEV